MQSKMDEILKDLIVDKLKQKFVASRNGVSESYISSINKKLNQLKYIPEVINSKIICLECGAKKELCIHHDHLSGRPIAIVCKSCNSKIHNKTDFENGTLSSNVYDEIVELKSVPYFVLTYLFPDKNTVKTIKHFIIHEKWEQNQKELCEILKIYPVAMRKILRHLVDIGLIIVTKQIAKSKFYKLNQDSNLIVPLRMISQNFSMQEALREADKQMVINGIAKEIADIIIAISSLRYHEPYRLVDIWKEDEINKGSFLLLIQLINLIKYHAPKFEVLDDDTLRLQATSQFFSSELSFRDKVIMYMDRYNIVSGNDAINIQDTLGSGIGMVIDFTETIEVLAKKRLIKSDDGKRHYLTEYGLFEAKKLSSEIGKKIHNGFELLDK